MIWSRTLFAAAALALVAGIAAAQDLTAAAPGPAIDLRLSGGGDETTISETVTGRDLALYRFTASAGRTVHVTMTSDNPAAYFNVYAPGSAPGDEALAVGEFTNPPNDWTRTLTRSGDYTISVYLYRAAARRGESATFTLTVSVDGDVAEIPSDAVVSDQLAATLVGGPDALAVSVTPGSALNLRAGPTSGTEVLAMLVNGAGLRNLGCRVIDGRRWCNVVTLTDPGTEGWVAGDYVIEADASKMPLPLSAPAASTGDTRVELEPDATGAELLGLLGAGESRRYVVDVRDGRTLRIDVSPDGPPITYRIINPDGTVLQDRLSSIRDYAAELTQSGDHIVELVNRTGADVAYSVVFEIE